MKKASLPKGTRDFLPETMRKRTWVVDQVKQVFESYGYSEIQTPSIEKWDVLKGKFGDEGEQLLFKILRRGTKAEELRLNKIDEVTFRDFDSLVDLVLRYDLTVPFSRMLSMNPNLPKPFKRYQIQPVWRGDRPKKGRYREFFQCDVDVAGTDSMLADAEIIAILHDVMTKLNFSQFKIRLNHRKILNGLIDSAGGGDDFKSICTAIDKLDKIGVEGVKSELVSRGINETQSNTILSRMNLKGEYKDVLNSLETLIDNHAEGQQGIEEMKTLYQMLGHLGVDLQKIGLDLHLVRGLDYYTGPIFEIEVENPSIGSLGGGGRYDHLIEKLSGVSLPATGSTLGLERIIDVMEELNLLPNLPPTTDLLVSVFHQDLLNETLDFAQQMRSLGIKTEVYLRPKHNLQKQIKYAGSCGIPVVAIRGSNEIKNSEVTLRTRLDGQKIEKTISINDAYSEIQKLLLLHQA